MGKTKKEAKKAMGVSPVTGRTLPEPYKEKQKEV